MVLDLIGYELTGTLEAVAVLAIVLVEAVVLYVAYTGYVRLAARAIDRFSGDAGDRS